MFLCLLFLRYKLKEEFAADTRLIFDNCETFNEDESEVGQAGHILRAFFEKRWTETIADPSDRQTTSWSLVIFIKYVQQQKTTEEFYLPNQRVTLSWWC